MKQHNKAIYIFLTTLFIVWIFISFVVFYYAIINRLFYGLFFTFIKYLVFIQPVSLLGIIYIFTKGNFREIKKHLKPIIIIISILTLFAFTLISWTITTTRYGQYGNYNEWTDDYVENIIYFPFDHSKSSAFEMETLYREAVEYKYNLTFQKILIFQLFVFGSVFLLLKAVNDNKK